MAQSWTENLGPCECCGAAEPVCAACGDCCFSNQATMTLRIQRFTCSYIPSGSPCGGTPQTTSAGGYDYDAGADIAMIPLSAGVWRSAVQVTFRGYVSALVSPPTNGECPPTVVSTSSTIWLFIRFNCDTEIWERGHSTTSETTPDSWSAVQLPASAAGPWCQGLDYEDVLDCTTGFVLHTSIITTAVLTIANNKCCNCGEEGECGPTSDGSDNTEPDHVCTDTQDEDCPP